MAIHFRKATGIFLQTMPFVLLRLGVGVLFGLLAAVYFGLVIGVLYWLGDSISGLIAFVGLLLAGILFVGFVRIVRRYVLYLVSAGHIAVIAHVVDTGEAPDEQLSYGVEKVKTNFASASALFAVDQVVKGVIKQFNGAVATFSDWVGFVPNLEKIIEVLRKSIALAASYIDEAILAHIFLSEETNNWRAARDGVVLYGKTWKPVLMATMIIVIAMYVIALLGLLVLTPIAAVISSLSTTFELVGWAVVAGLGLTGYLGLLRPWVKTVVITTFLIEAQEETPDSETADWITSKSDKFTELMEKAETEDSDQRGSDAPDSTGDPSPAP